MAGSSADSGNDNPHACKAATTIKGTLRQFVGLLFLGQIFLVGAIFQEKSASEAGFEPAPQVSYAMKVPDENAPSGSLKLASSLSSRGDGELPASSASPSMTAPIEEVSILGITHHEDEPIQKVEFDLSRPVKFTKLSHRGKVLRMRVQPPLSILASETATELGTIFIKFSQYRSIRYSDYVFYAPGNIGEPYLTTSTAGISQLVIPFKAKDVDFPLQVGESLTEGLTYYRDRVPTAAGPADVFLLRLEHPGTALCVIPVLANDGICQKEILSSIGRRYNAVAAINGCYFTQRGDPIGTLIINRRLISSPLYNRSVFGISTNGQPLFGNPDFSGVLEAGSSRVEIDAVNQPRTGDKLVVFTPEFARSTMTTESGRELVLVQGRVVGLHDRDSLIPPDGVVVSAGGSKSAALSGVRLGDMVKLDYEINAPWKTVQHAVCGGPRLLSEGLVDINGKEEKFDATITYGRHPRSAVGRTFNGDLLFVVVDGRSQQSAGMTLAELAGYIKKLGGCQAINLDGGGSSSMVVKGRVVNRPSDGRERPISNGIVITRN